MVMRSNMIASFKIPSQNFIDIFCSGMAYSCIVEQSLTNRCVILEKTMNHMLTMSFIDLNSWMKI
jgi:hypothetical protein